MEVGEAGEKACWPRTRSRLSRVLVSRFALKIYINYASGAATVRHVYSSVQSATEVFISCTCIQHPNERPLSFYYCTIESIHVACILCHNINSNILPTQYFPPSSSAVKIDLKKIQNIKSSLVPRNFALACRCAISGASTPAPDRASVYIIDITVESPEIWRPNLDACVNS